MSAFWKSLVVLLLGASGSLAHYAIAEPSTPAVAWLCSLLGQDGAGGESGQARPDGGAAREGQGHGGVSGLSARAA